MGLFDFLRKPRQEAENNAKPASTVAPKPQATTTTSTTQAKPTTTTTSTTQAKPAAASPTPVKPAVATSSVKPATSTPPVTSQPASAVVKPTITPTGDIQVVIGDKLVKFTTGKPYVESGDIVVPMRELAEHLGAKVEWDDKTRVAKLTKDDDIVEITIDASTAKVNGKEVKLAASAVMKENRIYLPIKFLADNLEAEYKYDVTTKIATIS